ncbi:hypothetical protein D477_012340 [Arthrobacter crystallopoietes BAB-32]|uniref:Plasmid pRiA4b Orf3-like domain-containing protein n=1 Tax=Arthrobacter crystallopoietes BAB-32 TaxID=1246476 RepID=N1V1H3_9MICC|nr:plasmid pRiA4b ORF-3 family protein [Arthrobacter crystallopoietes]EMY33917.1 hypothetical protein D477_012340 [Arthrobacter crystallopoietes BAB-32]
MAKKNQGRKNKGGRNRSGDPRKKAAGQGAISLGFVRAERALDPLLPDFVDWFAQDLGPAEEAVAYLDIMKAVAATYSDATGDASVTGFDPDHVSGLLAAIEATDPDEAVVVFEAFHCFIDFLHATGRWSRSEEDYQAVHAMLSDPGAEEGLPLIEVPELSSAEEAEALDALPLVQRARGLLEWLGAGKPVTATGALRLKDVEGAAASIGVAARGRSVQTAATEDTLPGLGDAPVASDQGKPAMVVQSMHEVPVLGTLWRTLAEEGLIEISPTGAVPQADGISPLSGASAEERLEELQVLIVGYLQNAVLDVDESQPWETAAAAIQVAVLVAGCTADPAPVERFQDVEAAGSEPAAVQARVAVRTAYARLQELAELGLVHIDTHITVPEALVRCIAFAFEEEYELDVDYPELAAEAVGMPEPVLPQAGGAAKQLGQPPARPASKRKAGTPSSVYQLKIMLSRSKPPIWRRVLVPSDIWLDQLHLVVQRSFDWECYHLHNFQVGGRGGRVYAPVDQDAYGDPPLDEATVALSDVLTGVGRKLEYTYDFGDDWVHVITLEKILPADPEGPLPRCTGGRGRAPMEDSGGVWGWTAAVEAANDPKHPAHQDYREMLGLEAGEKVDPKAFSVDQVNASLGLFAGRLS